ncbi:MAG: tetratricopeptide repeat protein [Novosphingobium sp.]
MTGQATGRVDVTKLVLWAAALLAVVGIGMTVLRSGSEIVQPVPLESSTAAAAGDPLEAMKSRVTERPADASAWQALGEEQFNRGAFADAIAAFDKAAQLSPTTAALWSALGEARVMASARDPMPALAFADFRRALAADPKDPRSRYFLAVKLDLDGDHQGAIAAWLALLKDTPPDAPWRSDLQRTIEQVGKINRLDVAARIAAQGPALPASSAPPGPTAQDLAAAASIPPGEQRKMAEGMVARLEARLKADPKNLDGWAMLIRSRAHLGEADKASQALRDAIAVNPDEAEQLRSMAAALRVK